MTKNPIYCAIDTNNIKQACELVGQIKSSVGGIKLGLEFFTHCGIDGINQIKKFGLPIFLDLKLYDIPHTVKSALQGILALEPELTTLHTLGGSEMLSACTDLRDTAQSKTKLIGVTVLTSFDEVGIKEIGIQNSLEDQVMRLTQLASLSKLDGIVCSPHEIRKIKKEYGNTIQLIVPGIRNINQTTNDQKRTMSAKEAVNAGADILVIGRPITQAADPEKAASDIFNSL